MKERRQFPKRDNNSVLEDISIAYFQGKLPAEWYAEKPRDFGIDLIVTPVVNYSVSGLNFSVQLKAQKDVKGKLEVRLKKTTLNYLFNRLEPIMIVLYDNKTAQAYWKWLIPEDFDLTVDKSTYSVRFEKDQRLLSINWEGVLDHVQKVFKVKNRLLTSKEFDLFNTESDLEAKAWAHYFGQNFNEASFYFKRLVQQDNPKSVWLLALAQSQYQIYDYKSALIYINRAIEMDKDDNILLSKGCILAEGGIKENDIRKLNEAEKIFEELYQRDPSSMNAYNYANTLSNLGKLGLAEKLYKHALYINPNYAEAWKNLGQVYNKLEKHDLEMKCYESALRINPDLIQAKIGKAITEGSVYKHYKKSIKVLLDCVRQTDIIYSEFPRIYYWLARFHFDLGNIGEAVEWVNKGLDNNPGDYLLVNLKAHILFDSLDRHADLIPQAISFFTDNYRLNSDDPVNLYFLCKSLETDNQQPAARELAIRWLSDRPIVKAFSDGSDGGLPFKDILLIIRHWDVIHKYSFRYPIDNIGVDLEYSEIQNCEPFLKWFEAARILFIARISEELFDGLKKPILIKKTVEYYKRWLSSTNESALFNLFSTSKSEKEKFIGELAKIASVLSTISFTEYTRSVAFVIGHKGLQKKYLPESMIYEGMLTESILHYTKIFYLHFELPMGESEGDDSLSCL